MQLLNKLDVTFNDTNGDCEIQYAIETVENPFSTDPSNPTVEQIDYWVWQGHLEAHGSELDFDGQGMHTRTNTGNPSLNEQDPVVAHFVFPYFSTDPGHLYLTLAADFGNIESPLGPTRNIILNKVS